MNDYIKEAITEGLQVLLEEEFDRTKAELVAKLESKRVEICGSVALDVMRHLNYATIGEQILITLQKKP